jgi:hypothetical protein
MEAAAPNCRTRRPSIIKGLHLSDAAIHEQFYSRDSSDARDHGLGDLIGVPNLPSGTVMEISFFCCSPTSEEGCRSLNPGVSMEPGLTAFTRMRRFFKSVVHVRTNERAYQ